MLRGCRNINVLLEKATFFRELASLGEGARWNPASVVDVGSHLTGRFREPAVGLGKELIEGKTLVEAMSAFPEWFDEYDLCIGRRLEWCPKERVAETLRAIALSCDLERIRIRDMQNTFSVPILVFSILWGLGFLIFRLGVFPYIQVFEELLEGEPLPGLTKFILTIASCTHDLILAPLLLFLPLGLMLVLLVGNRSLAVSESLLRYLPSFRRRLKQMDYFRVYTGLSVAFESALQVQEEFAMVASIIQDEVLEDAIGEIPNDTANLDECIGKMRESPVIASSLVDSLVVACKHHDSSGLWLGGEEMAHMAAYSITGTRNVICAILLLFSACLMGVVVLGLFYPLIIVH